MSTAGTSACRAAIHHARTPSAHLLILLGYAFGGGLPGLVTGAKQAGYSVTEEFPIFLGIFGVPALVAGLVLALGRQGFSQEPATAWPPPGVHAMSEAGLTPPRLIREVSGSSLLRLS